MVMSILNTRVVTPFVEVIDIAVSPISSNIPRNALQTVVEVTTDPDGNITSPPVSTVTLTSVPNHIEWVSVFVDGFRLVNETLDFGHTYQTYNVVGKVLTFTEPVLGRIVVLVDSPFYYKLPDVNYLDIKTVQGAATKARNPGDLYTAYFCEPVILTNPVHGFARLTDDRLSIVYVPSRDYQGYDAFSYSVITDRGQLADPKCVYIKVGSPAPLPKG